jgi:hypothetical protein
MIKTMIIMNYRRWNVGAVITVTGNIVGGVIYFSGIPVTTGVTLAVLVVLFSGVYIMMTSFKRARHAD